MSRTSNPNDLTVRLRNRPETDRRQIEETTASELRQLGESLRAVANDALPTIEADTAAAPARMRARLLNAWLRPLVVGLSFFLGFSGGSWAPMQWLSASLQYRNETLAALKVQNERARETVDRLADPIWGVTLREIDGERFVVLPDGTLDHPPWSVGGGHALKLSSE